MKRRRNSKTLDLGLARTASAISRDRVMGAAQARSERKSFERGMDQWNDQRTMRMTFRSPRLALTFGAIEPLETREHPEVPKR